jgi:hypothetical protein
MQGLPIALVDLSRPYGAASQSGKRFSEEPGPARVYAPRRNVELFVQSRDALTRDTTTCLIPGGCFGHRGRTCGRGKTFVSAAIMISQRPAELVDRPGHAAWKGCSGPW